MRAKIKRNPKLNHVQAKLIALDNKCNSQNIVYLAEIHPEGIETDKKFYIGVSKGPWKTRYNNHTHSFRGK